AVDQAADARPLMAVGMGAAAGREGDAVAAQEKLARGQRVERRGQLLARGHAGRSASGRRSKSKRQQVAPVLPATSVAALSPCQASPSRSACPAMVAPPCTRKTMRAAAGSASAAPSDNTSS